MVRRNYAVRITRSYQDISGLVQLWNPHMTKLILYEHVGTATEKVHCHLLLVGLYCTKERLKQLVPRFMHFKGNEDWSFKECKESYEKYITYMSKGKFNPLFNSGFTDSEIQSYKAKWVEPTKRLNKDQMLVAQFYNHVYTKWEDDNEGLEFPNILDTQIIEQMIKDGKTQNDYIYLWVRRVAFSYAMKECGNIFTVRTSNMARTCCISFCHQQEIDIPIDKITKI